MTAQLDAPLHDAPRAPALPPLHAGSARERIAARPAGAADRVMRPAPRFGSVDELLADARSRLTRLSVEDMPAALAHGARLVDIRPAWQREVEGEIPGSLVVERNHLEWRLHPASSARVPQAVEGQRWVVVCSEGYTSSLAADVLNALGIPATDLVGGFRAWQAAGLPTSATVTAPNQICHGNALPQPRISMTNREKGGPVGG